MHKLTYEIKTYPGTGFARKITFVCTCGKKGKLTDGRTAPTMARARTAAKKHTKVVL